MRYAFPTVGEYSRFRCGCVAEAGRSVTTAVFGRTASITAPLPLPLDTLGADFLTLSSDTMIGES
jgi:hypothetical protein